MQPPTEELHLWAAELLALPVLTLPTVSTHRWGDSGIVPSQSGLLWHSCCKYNTYLILLLAWLLWRNLFSPCRTGAAGLRPNALYRNMAASLPTQSTNAAWRQLCSQVSLHCNIRACSSSLRKEKASPYSTKKNHIGESGKQTCR